VIGSVSIDQAVWHCAMGAYRREQERVEHDYEVALLATDTDRWERLVIVQAGSISAPVADQIGWLACLL
jgi:hypothetical protein